MWAKALSRRSTTLLGSLTDDEYWSEYGVLVVIDAPGGDDGGDVLDPELGVDGELLAVSAMELVPGWTVAHADAG